MQRFFALTHARNMEFLRDKSTLFWNLFFPIILIFGFSFAFPAQNNEVFKVGVYGEVDESLEFMRESYVEGIEYDDFDAAVDKLRRHQLDLAIDFTNNVYVTNQESGKARVAAKLFSSMTNTSVDFNSDSQAGSDENTMSDQSLKSFTLKSISGEPIRYIDWFIPGLIAMNMAFSCMFGVGWIVIRYRKNGVLKRLKATPVQSVEFILSQISSRLTIVLFSSIVVYFGSNFFLNYLMKGSYFDLLIMVVLTTVCMISLGLAISSRMRSEEFGGGILNIVMWPMMIFSGVFFSLEGTPKIIKNISRIFPLTHFTESARAIMIDGSGLIDLLPNITFILLLTIIFISYASLMFRWD